MSPPGDLTVDVEVVPEEISAGDVLAEFLLIMDEWGFRPYRSPGSVPPEEQVTLPGPDVLRDRAELARLQVETLRAGRS